MFPRFCSRWVSMNSLYHVFWQINFFHMKIYPLVHKYSYLHYPPKPFFLIYNNHTKSQDLHFLEGFGCIGSNVGHGCRMHALSYFITHCTRRTNNRDFFFKYLHFLGCGASKHEVTAILV